MVLVAILLLAGEITDGVKIEKELLYDRHTLDDIYTYGKVERSFQWQKMSDLIDSLLIFEEMAKEFGALSN